MCDNRDGFRLRYCFTLASMPFAKLVSLHGRVLVFLQRAFPGRGVWYVIVVFASVRVLLEGRVPAKENQGRDDQNFSQ